MSRSRRPPPPRPVPSYGVLIGRMIFTGGLVLALVGLGFLVMLGLAAGSGLALVIFGLTTLAGVVICGLAARDLAGVPVEQPARVIAKVQHSEGGNPNYELQLSILNPALSNRPAGMRYNVTQQDWERFAVGDRVLVRYSTYFKLLVDIRLMAKGS